MHALVDMVSGIPLSYIITPTNIADIDMAEPLIQKLLKDYEKSFTPKYYIMNTAHVKLDIYRSICTTMKQK